MHPNYTNNLLNLKGVFIKKISYSDCSISISLSSKPSEHICPCCGKSTRRVHDYREQHIKDIPIHGKKVILVLNKRRYRCSCGKRFFEKYDFLPKYHRMTNRLAFHICRQLTQLISMSQVAVNCNVSISTVMRIFNYINYPKQSIPKVFCIDEFKGNAETGKYQCIIVDGKKNKIVDILKNRSQAYLSSYLSSIPKFQRHNVTHFVSDMWRPYIDLAKIYFPNAKIIIDKYHFIRQVTWAIESVRKRLQKTMPFDLRKYFKRSRKLILTRYHKLSNDNKQALDNMLLYNDDLRFAHKLKEWFYSICQSNKYSLQRTDFYEWIRNAESCGIKEFEKCAKTFRYWSKEILNAFKYGFTNGPTEGFNNKIKVLKRISFGIKNFDRFRNRILHCSI